MFNPADPFSKAALLKQEYTRSRAQTGQQMASGGQQYSGAYGSAQRYIGRQQLGAEDQLTRSLTDFLAQNTGQMTDAQTAYEQGAAQALSESTDRALANPLYSPTTDVAQPAAAGPTKATASVGRPQKTVNGQRFYQRASDGKWIPF